MVLEATGTHILPRAARDLKERLLGSATQQHAKEFRMMGDYANALEKQDPGSLVKVSLELSFDTQIRRKFYPEVSLQIPDPSSS